MWCNKLYKRGWAWRFTFQRVIAERRKTFNPNNIVDFIDAFLLEQQKEKAESPNSNYYSGE